MANIQVDPCLLPAIRAVYTQDVAGKLGHLRPDERAELEATLKLVDEEENRTPRLFAAGKISESVWESMWHEWQDRRSRVRSALVTLAEQQETHLENLETALEMITRVGDVYNVLKRSDQKELLRNMVTRVVIDHEGSVDLELRAPFSYLQDITHRLRGGREALEVGCGQKEAGAFTCPGFSRTEGSLTVLSCWKDWITLEHSFPRNTAQFLDSLPFPQREFLAPFMTNPH